MADEPSTYEKDTRAMTNEFKTDLEKDIDKIEKAIEKRLDDIWDVLEKMRNRPPVWVTTIISILCLLVGWLFNNCFKM